MGMAAIAQTELFFLEENMDRAVWHTEFFLGLTLFQFSEAFMVSGFVLLLTCSFIAVITMIVLDLVADEDVEDFLKRAPVALRLPYLTILYGTVSLGIGNILG